ncbi:hypothetical protein [Myxosarcina sp. GI1(2024)]
MFNIGDRVLQKKTGNIGEVIGHGHELIGECYQPTIKVLFLEPTGKKTVIEDIPTEWKPVSNQQTKLAKN